MRADILQAEHNKLRDRAARFCDEFQHQLITLIDSQSIALAVPLEGRVKSWESIEEKISRKSLSIARLSDLDDLIGIRVIVLFRRDLDSIDKIIRKTFQIDQAEDTSFRLSESQFGYQSLHYVARFPNSWLQIPTLQEFSDLKVEIQIRTAAQHIWAASSHKLQYKHEHSVPEPLRRSIYRVSALLETVDLEFDRLLSERESYVLQQAESHNTDELLNVDIVSAILTDALPAKNKKNPEDYADLLVDLQHFGIDTESKLRAMLERHIDSVLKDDAEMAKTRETNAFYRHVGLARCALRKEVGDLEVSEFHLSKMNAEHEMEDEE